MLRRVQNDCVIPTLHSAVLLMFWLKLVRTTILNILPYRKIIYLTYILHSVPLKNFNHCILSLATFLMVFSRSVSRVTAVHTEKECLSPITYNFVNRVQKTYIWYQIL